MLPYDPSAAASEPLPPNPYFAWCGHCGRRFRTSAEESAGMEVRISPRNPAGLEHVGRCGRCADAAAVAPLPVLSEHAVALELQSICERARGHEARGMTRDQAITWAVEAQMAAEDATDPGFRRYLRERALARTA